ncbi:hypothetical protein [Bacillus cereus]|uniref:hypothetical protein n=1 Tax=Bacillus cereus TaxID=1396 RepID=UPI0023490440|nr:hypothetical protein [Bacillus cereus]
MIKELFKRRSVYYDKVRGTRKNLKVIQQDVKNLEERILATEKFNENNKWILRLIISVLLTGVLGVLARSLL